MDKTRFLALVLLSAVGTSGCNTTASHSLALAIDSYDTRSNDAIGSLQTIEAKVVEQPPVSASDAERRFVRDALSGVAITEAAVEEMLHPNASPPRKARGLAEMRCGHVRFTAAFAQLENAGVFGKRTVSARAPGVLDALVAQQLAMARIVQDNPEYVRLMVRRQAWGADLAAVRANSESREAKERAAVALRTQLIAIEQEEAQLRADALEDLLKAAATGIALREQLEQYGRWSLSDLTDSLAGLTGFIGKVSGRDFAQLNGRIDELEGQIAGDPALVARLEQALASTPVPQADGSFAADAADERPGRGAAGASATPCLDRAPPELPALEPAEPPQPAVPPAVPPAAAPQARAPDGHAMMGA